MQSNFNFYYHLQTATTKYSISVAFLLFKALSISLPAQAKGWWYRFWVSSQNREALGTGASGILREQPPLGLGTPVTCLPVSGPEAQSAQQPGVILTCRRYSLAWRSDLPCVPRRHSTWTRGCRAQARRWLFLHQGRGCSHWGPSPCCQPAKTMQVSIREDLSPQSSEILTHLPWNFLVWVPGTWKEPKALLWYWWCKRHPWPSPGSSTYYLLIFPYLIWKEGWKVSYKDTQIWPDVPMFIFSRHAETCYLKRPPASSSFHTSIYFFKLPKQSRVEAFFQGGTSPP